MHATSTTLRRTVRLPLVTLIAGIALFFAAALGPAQRSDAQAPAPATSPAKVAPRASLTDIEDEVMCVVCGRPLSTSAGTAADDERSVIQGYIDQGLDKREIKEQLVQEFGKQVLVNNSDPIAGGAPIIAAVIGVLSVGLLLRRRIVSGRAGDQVEDDEHEGPGVSSTESHLEPTDEDEARIDAELAQRD